MAGFVSFGIATFRARIYPRWTGLVIATGSVAAIVLAPLASVPSGPFRLDRIGVLAAAIAFAWCGWHLLRHAAGPKFANGDARHTTGADGGPRRGGAAAQRGPHPPGGSSVTKTPARQTPAGASAGPPGHLAVSG